MVIQAGERGARGREEKLVVLAKKRISKKLKPVRYGPPQSQWGRQEKGRGPDSVGLSVGRSVCRCTQSVGDGCCGEDGNVEGPQSLAKARLAVQASWREKKTKLATGKRLAAREEDGCCAKCHGLVGRAVPP